MCGAVLVAGAPTEALVAARTALLQLHFNGTHRCSGMLQLDPRPPLASTKPEAPQAWRGLQVLTVPLPAA